MLFFPMELIVKITQSNSGQHKLRTGVISHIIFPGLKWDMYRIESRHLETFTAITMIFWYRILPKYQSILFEEKQKTSPLPRIVLETLTFFFMFKARS